MRFLDFLAEAPLPSNWDNKKLDFTKEHFVDIIEYALARAKKIGAGTARVVFNVRYNGRQTALKIAKNEAGLHQNEEELKWFKLLGNSDIVIPFIDYDTEHAKPVWIHTEKAKKLTPRKFKELTGENFNEFLFYTIQQNRFDEMGYKDTHNTIPNNPLYVKIKKLLKMGFPHNDLDDIHSWGIWENRPVIVDLGYSDEIFDKFYKDF